MTYDEVRKYHTTNLGVWPVTITHHHNSFLNNRKVFIVGTNDSNFGVECWIREMQITVIVNCLSLTMGHKNGNS